MDEGAPKNDTERLLELNLPSEARAVLEAAPSVAVASRVAALVDMRRRDPDCLMIGDDRPTNKKR